MGRGLPKKVKSLLEKSREAALLAVEVYNKPNTAFRTGGYIVLMNIAWTSLFHAIFERRGIPYYYKENKRRYKKVDGERKAWELKECIRQYYKDKNPPERKNLEFFIKLRNKIEHRFLPQLDIDIFGECQAMLINYENLLVEKFGERYALKENLVFTLQFSSYYQKEQQAAIKGKIAKEYEDVKCFIDKYRHNLSSDIFSDLRYSFKVFLIPKVGNRRSSSDIAIEFIKYDPTNPEEMKQYEKFIVAIKEKRVINEGFKAGEVAAKVYNALKDEMPQDWKFNASYHHAKCWKYYNIRPEKGDPNPEKTKEKYCYYDKPFDQYVYTQEWIDFLIKELKDLEKYKKIFGRYPYKCTPPQSSRKH